MGAERCRAQVPGGTLLDYNRIRPLVEHARDMLIEDPVIAKCENGRPRLLARRSGIDSLATAQLGCAASGGDALMAGVEWLGFPE